MNIEENLTFGFPINKDLTLDDSIIINGDAETLKYIFKNNGIDILKRRYFDPKMLAINNNQLKTLKILIRADLPLQKHCISTAIATKNESIIEYLMKFDISELSDRDIEILIGLKYLKTLQLYFLNGIKTTQIQQIIHNRFYELLEYLIGSKIISGEDLISMICICGTIDDLKYFNKYIPSYVDLNDSISYKKNNITNYLLDIGVRPNRYTLNLSAKFGAFELIQRIIGYGIKPTISILHQLKNGGRSSIIFNSLKNIVGHDKIIY